MMLNSLKVFKANWRYLCWERIEDFSL